LNGILLPFVLVFMLILINRERLMGEYRNGPWGNFIAGATSVIMVLLTIALIYNSITG
jgi:Mn2+/Fe2+ NRAMP family transporter